MNMSDENVREDRHLMLEERIAAQAEEIKQLQAIEKRDAALKKAREAIKAAWSGECSANKALDKASEALKLIDKVIGGKEDV